MAYIYPFALRPMTLPSLTNVSVNSGRAGGRTGGRAVRTSSGDECGTVWRDKASTTIETNILCWTLRACLRAFALKGASRRQGNSSSSSARVFLLMMCACVGVYVVQRGISKSRFSSSLCDPGARAHHHTHAHQIRVVSSFDFASMRAKHKLIHSTQTHVSFAGGSRARAYVQTSTHAVVHTDI